MGMPARIAALRQLHELRLLGSMGVPFLPELHRLSALPALRSIHICEARMPDLLWVQVRAAGTGSGADLLTVLQLPHLLPFKRLACSLTPAARRDSPA